MPSQSPDIRKFLANDIRVELSEEFDRRLIVEDPRLSDKFMLRGVENRQKAGKVIDEVWVKSGSHIRLLYKK